MQTLCAALLIGSLTAGAPPHDSDRATPASHPAPLTTSCTMPGHEATFTTPHFRLRYTDNKPEVQAIATDAEQTYDEVLAFCAYHELTVTPPSQELEILFFSDTKAFQACAQRAGLVHTNSYGFYDEKTNRCVFLDLATNAEIAEVRNALQQAQQNANTIKAQLAAAKPDAGEITLTYGDGSQVTLPVTEARRTSSAAQAQLRQIQARYDRYTGEINRTVTRHEIAHQVFFNISVLRRGSPMPSWFVEGLAMLFETPEPPNATRRRGVNSLRHGDLHDAVCPDGSDEAMNVERVLAALHEGRLLPLRELVGTSWDDNRRLGQASHKEEGPPSRLYAQSWALVYYLHSREKDRLAEYVKRIHRRTEASISAEVEIHDFEAAFGPLDEAFTRRWAAWLVSLSTCSKAP